MAILLVVAAGFLIGGAFSSWQQGGAAAGEGQARKALQLRILAGLLLVLSALCATSGVLRLR